MFFGEGPTACPFVALESDRDRRSDEPDHRHRCYAEPDPAPRALAHQREYCLAAAFTTCPIFQDWAIRAAATPVPLRPGRMAETERDPEPAWAAPPPWLDGERGREMPADAPDIPDASVEGFVSPPARSSEDELGTSPDDIELLPSMPLEGEPGAPPMPRRREPAPEPPRQPQQHAAEPEEKSPLPAFLEGRAEQIRKGSQAPGRLPAETLRREDVVPVWGRQPLYGYQTRSRVHLGGSGGWLNRIITLLAIGVILSLAVVAVILAPSLLGGGGGPRPTLPPVGGSPSPPAGQPMPSPGRTPTPVPSQRLYTVQSGDTLFSIARSFGLTVEQLLAANPQVTNPDLVQIGQVLIIPDDDFGLFTPAPGSPRSSP